VRSHGAYALLERPSSSAYSALVEALADEEWQVRIGAIDALAALGDDRAIGSLQRLVFGDKSIIVRDGAADAVRRLTPR